MTASVLAVSTLAVAAAPADAAASPIKIVKIYYDSPGSPDNGKNSSLNGEYIQIKNTGKKAVSLKGWTVRDKTKRPDHI